MFNLYENIKNLCNEKGITPSRLCVETGVSKSTVSQLKNGLITTINMQTATKFADYLQTLFFMGKKKRQPPPLTIALLQEKK